MVSAKPYRQIGFVNQYIMTDADRLVIVFNDFLSLRYGDRTGPDTE